MRTLRPARPRLPVPLIVAAAASFAAPAFANPSGPTLVRGAAQLSNPAANVLQVVNTPGTIINWNGFSIAGGETTRFVQLNAASAVLNRVTGGNPSSILGRLESNGRVFLVNPNGIVFGGSAVVDVAGLIASTRDISNDNFSNGNYQFSGAGSGNVTVQSGAQILTSGSGGQVWLIANQVNAEAGSRITAPQGQVVLAAGSSVSVGNSNLGEMSFSVSTGVGNTVNALGEIVAQRGAVGFFADSVNIGNAVSAMGGSVTVSAARDVVVRSGTSVDVSGSGNEAGGSISIEARRMLQMEGTAELNADGGILGGDGGHISLTAHDLRLPVAGLTRGASLVHAFASASSSTHGTVTLNQTGTFSYTGTDREVRNFSNPSAPSAITIPGMDGGFLSVITPGSSDSAAREIRVYAGDGTPRGSNITLTLPGLQTVRSSGLSDGSYMLLWNDSGVHSMQLIRANGTLGGEVINLTARGETVFDIQPLLSGGYISNGGSGTARLYDNNAQLVRTITGLPAGTLIPMARGFAIVNVTGAPGYSVQRFDAAGNAIGGVTQYGRSDIAFPSGFTDHNALTAPIGQQLHADGYFALPNFGISAELLPGQQFLASKLFTDPMQLRRFSVGGLEPLGPGFTYLNALRAGLADGSFASVHTASGTVSVLSGDGTLLLNEANRSSSRPSALGNGGFAVAGLESLGGNSYRVAIRTYEKTSLGLAPPVPGMASGGVGRSATFATRPGSATDTGVPPSAGSGSPTVVTGSGSGAVFGGVASEGCNAAVCSPQVRAAVALVEATRGAEAAAAVYAARPSGGAANAQTAAEAAVRAVWTEVVTRNRSPEDIQREEAAILRDQQDVHNMLDRFARETANVRNDGSSDAQRHRDKLEALGRVVRQTVEDHLKQEQLFQQTGLHRSVPEERRLVHALLNMGEEERQAFGETLVRLMQTDPTFGEPPPQPVDAPAPAQAASGQPPGPMTPNQQPVVNFQRDGQIVERSDETAATEEEVLAQQRQEFNDAFRPRDSQ